MPPSTGERNVFASTPTTTTSFGAPCEPRTEKRVSIAWFSSRSTAPAAVRPIAPADRRERRDEQQRGAPAPARRGAQPRLRHGSPGARLTASAACRCCGAACTSCTRGRRCSVSPVASRSLIRTRIRCFGRPRRSTRTRRSRAGAHAHELAVHADLGRGDRLADRHEQPDVEVATAGARDARQVALAGLDLDDRAAAEVLDVDLALARAEERPVAAVLGVPVGAANGRRAVVAGRAEAALGLAPDEARRGLRLGLRLRLRRGLRARLSVQSGWSPVRMTSTSDPLAAWKKRNWPPQKSPVCVGP